SAGAQDTESPGSAATGSLTPAQCALQCRNHATGRAFPAFSAPSNRACLARHLSLLHPLITAPPVGYQQKITERSCGLSTGIISSDLRSFTRLGRRSTSPRKT